MIDATFPEALAAMTGITPTRAPSELEVRGALNYVARIKRRLAAFLEADKIAPMKWKAPPSQDSLYESLTAPLDEAEAGTWFAPDSAEFPAMVAYPMIVKSAKEYVLGRWPIYQDTSLGLHTYELAPDEYGDVWHLFSTANDPETIFDDMDSMLLLPVQVDAFAAIYPELYAATKNMAAMLLQPYIGVEGMIEQKKVLSFEREEQIRILLQRPIDGPIEVAEENAAADNPGGAPKPSQQKSTQTPSEHMAEKRISK